MKRIAILVLTLLPLFALSQTSWIALGQDIDGLNVGENSATDISLNSDGTILVVGAPYNDVTATNSGAVRVYERTLTGYVQRGADVNGTTQGDLLGSSVSINGAGNVIAMGAPAFLNPNYLSPQGLAGYTRIMEWNGTSWIQRGNDIIGEAANDTAGTAIDLSEDGSTIIIGASSNSDGGNEAGHCRIYDWDGTAWNQRGNDIDGAAPRNASGSAVAINNSGNIIMVSAIGDDTLASNSGNCRIFEWNGTNWIQRGSNVTGGNNAPDRFGAIVSMNASGDVISIGAFGNIVTGYTNIYEWNGSDYVQKGSTIDGDMGSDFSGSGATLNDNGDVIALGAYGNNNGYARVYSFVNNDWSQIGSDIIGEAASDQFGRSIGLDATGNIVAVGTPFNDGNGQDSGHVRVFETATLSEESVTKRNSALYPNPSSDFVLITNSDTIQNVTIYNTVGQLLFQQKGTGNELKIDVSHLASGNYLTVIETLNSKQVLKFVKI